MGRRARRIALLLLALAVVVGIAVLVATSRGQLSDDRDRAEERWIDLRGPLAERYAQLDTVLAELRAQDAGDLDVTTDLARELERWQRLQQQSGDDVDTEAEVGSANALEGIASRVARRVGSSPRLSGSEPLTAALAAFAALPPPAPAVTAYNDAVASYQNTREELRYSLTAQVFGYEALPELSLAPA